MVLTDNGVLQASHDPSDKRVAGVISGAGGYRPGLILDRSAASQERMPLDVMVEVDCKMDADPAAISVGDLLTTSGWPGFGMKETDSTLRFGAVN